MPWVLAAIAVSAVFYTGGEAAEKTTDLTKWALVGGVLFVGYKVSTTAGLIK